MKTRLYVALLGCVAIGGSCKKDSDSVGTNSCAQIQQRAADVTQAATAYSTSLTKANCEAYKKAVNDYLSSAANCPTVTQADITQARNSINSLDCK